MGKKSLHLSFADTMTRKRDSQYDVPPDYDNSFIGSLLVRGYVR
jgi:hypothetical protein